jgi:hypothetical protein
VSNSGRSREYLLPLEKGIAAASNSYGIRLALLGLVVLGNLSVFIAVIAAMPFMGLAPQSTPAPQPSTRPTNVPPTVGSTSTARSTPRTTPIPSSSTVNYVPRLIMINTTLSTQNIRYGLTTITVESIKMESNMSELLLTISSEYPGQNPRDPGRIWINAILAQDMSGAFLPGTFDGGNVSSLFSAGSIHSKRVVFGRPLQLPASLIITYYFDNDSDFKYFQLTIPDR